MNVKMFLLSFAAGMFLMLSSASAQQTNSTILNNANFTTTPASPDWVNSTGTAGGCTVFFNIYNTTGKWSETKCTGRANNGIAFWNQSFYVNSSMSGSNLNSAFVNFNSSQKICTTCGTSTAKVILRDTTGKDNLIWTGTDTAVTNAQFGITIGVNNFSTSGIYVLSLYSNPTTGSSSSAAADLLWDNVQMSMTFTPPSTNTCTPPAANNDWIIKDYCTKSSTNIDLGTGKVYVTTGGTLALINSVVHAASFFGNQLISFYLQGTSMIYAK